jgi:hypothetical protein
MPKRHGAAPNYKPAPASRNTRVRRAAVVTVRTLIAGRQIEGRVPPSAPIEELAGEWAYLLRSRARWVDQSSVRYSLRDRALTDLAQLGLKQAFIKRLATVYHVEVEMHQWDVNDATATRLHEAASAFPWEYLLSAATRGAGRFQPILITRLTRNGAGTRS